MTTKACKESGRKHTPIVSEAQRGAMGAAYAAKTGEKPMSSLQGPAREMAKSMPAAELARHLEEAGGKSLPARTTHKRKGVKGNTFYGTKLLSSS
jgi:hypothetical protein